MEIGISTGFFHGQSIFDALEPIKRSGIKYVELWTFSKMLDENKHFDPLDALQTIRLGKILDEFSIKAVSIHAPFAADLDLSSPDEAIRKEAVRQAAISACALHRVSDGISNILVAHPSSVPLKNGETKTRFDQARRSVTEIITRIRPLGMKLALENQLPHIFGHSPETLFALMEGFGPEDIGICFDTSHASLHANTTVEDMLQRFSGRILTLHVSDSDFSHDNHFAFGEGKINWQNTIVRLKESGYTGVFMNEILKEISGKDRAETMKTVKEREAMIL